jgi:hypothetical protein
MSEKTEQALTDALIDQIESAARASFRRHQGSIKGQILTAADNYDWHLLHAAYQAGIHAMRAQLDEVRKDAALEQALQQATMSLAELDMRDYFAAQAIGPLLQQIEPYTHENWRLGIAADAYAIADAMLAARERAPS